MSESLTATLDSMPGWVVPAGALTLVVLALASSRKSGSAPGYGAVGVLEPRPADPGLVALAQSEVGAKASAFETMVAALHGEHLQELVNAHDIAISHVAADRDVALGTIQANVANYSTQMSAATAIEQARQAASLGIHQADVAKQITDSQGATAKYLAKKQAQSSIWGSVLHFGSSIANLFKH